MFETVSLRDTLTIISLTTHDKDSLVVKLAQFAKGSVRLYNETLVQSCKIELLCDVCDAGSFGAAAAIREEDEWDLFGLEVRESCCSAGQGSGFAEKNAVDVEGECEVWNAAVGDLWDGVGLVGSCLPYLLLLLPLRQDSRSATSCGASCEAADKRSQLCRGGCHRRSAREWQEVDESFGDGLAPAGSLVTIVRPPTNEETSTTS